MTKKVFLLILVLVLNEKVLAGKFDHDWVDIPVKCSGRLITVAPLHIQTRCTLCGDITPWDSRARAKIASTDYLCQKMSSGGVSGYRCVNCSIEAASRVAGICPVKLELAKLESSSGGGGGGGGGES